MPILDISVQLGCATTAVINANPNYLLLVGQILFYTDGVNKDKYYRGDGVTLLSSLPLLGGSGGGGLTVGTTTITSGTNTRILYNNAGVVGEYLVTGTGTTAVLSTSPTFTTDITTPLIIGGSAVGSTIQYKGTSGVGTSTVAAHQFLVGNNGATTAMSIYNSGIVDIGNYASAGAQRLVTIGQDTAWMSLGSAVGFTSYSAMYFNTTTPAATNYAFASDGNDMLLNAPLSTGAISLRVANTIKFSASSSGVLFNVGSGGTVTFGDGNNMVFNATTGTKHGTATTQKQSFWNATPIVQPTTAVAASTLTSNGGTTLTSTDTIDGYTLLQVVKALRNIGLLA